MTNKSRLFKAVDLLYLALTLLPIVCGIVLRILTKPASEGISISGAQIYFTVKMPIQDLIITESQINSWLVMISIFGLCLFLTHGLRTRHVSTRQHIAEWLVEKASKLVTGSMGEHFTSFIPFIAAIMALSAFSSLLALTGLFAPTSDINVTAGWAILVFFLIIHHRRCGSGSRSCAALLAADGLLDFLFLVVIHIIFIVIIVIVICVGLGELLNGIPNAHLYISS